MLKVHRFTPKILAKRDLTRYARISIDIFAAFGGGTEVIMKTDKEYLIRAHDECKNHKPELEVPQKCGCFYCKKIFDSSEIERWLTHDNPADRRGTAICPYCGVDSVIGEKSGHRITPEFLEAMHKEWFETIIT